MTHAASRARDRYPALGFRCAWTTLLALALGLGACAAGDDGGSSSGRDGSLDARRGPGGDASVGSMTDASMDVDYYALRHDGMAEPPQMFCDPDGGRRTADAGADPFCPTDRNLQGCPCETPGERAPCWTGPRSARERGSCHDGTTTCRGVEIQTWGPCEGEVLPDPTATTGPSACTCFSSGTWNIANVSPCFISDSTGRRVVGATSTTWDGSRAACPPPPTSGTALTAPREPWSPNSLRVDCGGTFHVCYRLRAFATLAAAEAHTVSATDCVMANPCVDAVLPPSGASAGIALPPLPGWATTTSAQIACAQRFVANGGYAEMVVSGLSSECQDFGQGMTGGVTFNRLGYCPTACNDPSVPVNERPAICAMCSNGASGDF